MNTEKEFPVHILEVDINRNPEMFGKSYGKYEEMGYAHVFLPSLGLHLQNIPFYIQKAVKPKFAVIVSFIGKRRYFENGPTKTPSIYHEDFDIWEPIILMFRSYLLKERVDFDDEYIDDTKKDWCSKAAIRYLD